MQTVKIFTDLFYGDSGKGTMVDWYTRLFGVQVVIRTSGGSQAAHHVETPLGQVYCFRQFGSGAFVSGTKTILTSFTLINPYNISVEMRKLLDVGVDNPLANLIISEGCLVITPFHTILNKMLEASRGKNRHGSVGMGVGQAIRESQEFPEDAIYAADLKYNGVLHAKLTRARYRTILSAKKIAKQNPDNQFIQERLAILLKMSITEFIDFYLDFALNTEIEILGNERIFQHIKKYKSIVFEPTQGVLLDPDFGFTPHITKTSTTAHNARKIMNLIGGDFTVSETGIVRAYATRHGVGPFVTEDIYLNGKIVDKNNTPNDWQGEMRYGWFDLPAVRYALMSNDGVDDLALTCLDQLNFLPEIKVCCSYEYVGEETKALDQFFEWEEFSGGRKKIINFRKTQREQDKRDLTKILFDCIPLEYKVFPGWEGAITKKLNNEAKTFLDFLQSKSGLDLPIKVVSIGPTWEDKIVL